MSGSDWPYRSASEQIAALATNEVSSVELTDAAIARIEALDPKINAVVVRDFERAREAAGAADAALARGERRPLLGLPMTVKESFNIAGLATSWGQPRFKDWRPAEDALAVERLKTAGAVILGKTNVPLMLADWQSYNDIFGTTKNPWDLTRTPGGSSGGSAAALASGYIPLELGSDIGGSLRAPAHYCGIYAHKPTLDLVPQRGGGPPETPAIPARGEFAVTGPMARSAADLALELEVIAGPDPLLDGIGYRLALPAATHARLADYRVLVMDRHPLVPTAHCITAALDTLSESLVRAGCRVMRDSPFLPDLVVTTQLYSELLMAFFSADMAPEERARAATAAAALASDDRSLAACRRRGMALTHADWLQAWRRRTALQRRWQRLFDEFDVLLCPVMPTTAFAHDHSPHLQRRLAVDGVEMSYQDQIAWIAAATLAGLPATVAPIGRSSEGLPIGVQIVGGWLRDRTTIGFAGLIEREFGGFVPPPLD